MIFRIRVDNFFVMIKSRGYKLILLFLLQLCFGTSGAFGQGNLLYYNKVDTLSFVQRFNFKTNFVDWVTLTPNIGIEFAIGNKNWNRWTIGAHGRFNWNTNSKENMYYVYDLYGGRIELRRYWHGKMPKRVFYWGVYGGANKFNIKFSSTGREGQSIIGGLSFGTITQLYGYQNGSRLDLSLGVNAGITFAKYHEYQREFVGNKYIYNTIKPENGYKITFSPWIYALSTDIIDISLIYHFGTKLSNRYKKRLLVDNDYRIALEAEKLRRDSLNTVIEKRRKQRADSLEKIDYEKRFEQQRLELEKKHQDDSLREVNKLLKIEAIKNKKEEKRIADSLKVVDREKAIEERTNAKKMADSLKAANVKKAREMKLQKEQERENAKKIADSLRIVHKNQQLEALAMKEKAKENARHEKDSLRQVEELKRQDVIKAKEEKKELKRRRKVEKTRKESENSPQENPISDRNDTSKNNNQDAVGEVGDKKE